MKQEQAEMEKKLEGEKDAKLEALGELRDKKKRKDRVLPADHYKKKAEAAISQGKTVSTYLQGKIDEEKKLVEERERNAEVRVQAESLICTLLRSVSSWGTAPIDREVAKLRMEFPKESRELPKTVALTEGESEQGGKLICLVIEKHAPGFLERLGPELALVVWVGVTANARLQVIDAVNSVVNDINYKKAGGKQPEDGA